jgi:hypothetical protein
MFRYIKRSRQFRSKPLPIAYIRHHVVYYVRIKGPTMSHPRYQDYP